MTYTIANAPNGFELNSEGGSITIETDDTALIGQSFTVVGHLQTEASFVDQNDANQDVLTVTVGMDCSFDELLTLSSVAD